MGGAGRLLLPTALVFAVAFITYVNNLGNDFVYDDRYLVERNPFVQETDWKALATTSYWGELVSAGLYRPLTLLSLGANRAWCGPEPWSFHLVNNLLHALASSSVFLMALRLGASSFAALAAALVFAVHPVHSEAVNAVVGRAEILACGFAIAALALHARDKSSGWCAAGAGLAYLAALLAKETAAFALPLFVLCHVVLRRKVAGRRYVALALALMIYIVIRWSALGGIGITGREIGLLDNPVAHEGLAARLLTAPVLLGRYIGLLLVPWNLSADYSFNQIPLARSILDPRVLGGVAEGIGLVAAFSLALGRGQRLLAFAVAAMTIPLFGLLHLLFPLGTLFAERLAYLPSFGMALAVGIALDALASRLRALGLASLALLTGLGWARTVERNRDWKDNETLFRRTVVTAPSSARSHFLVATALFEKQDLAGAAAAFAEGLKIAPEHPEGRQGLAQSSRALAGQLYNRGRLEEALPVLQRAVAIEAQVEDMNQLGFILGAMGRHDEAEPWHRRALEREPDNAVAFNFLGVIQERRSKREEARSFYLEALASRPDLVPALLNLGSLNLNEGQWGAAEGYFRRASELAPRSYEAFNSLGIALARLGRADEAAGAFRTAMNIDPSLEAARANLRALEK